MSTQTNTENSGGLAGFDLNGKNIVLTGGGYGLGRSMAIGLAAAGARLMIAGRTLERLEETAQLIRDSGGEVSCRVLDATDRQSAIDMVEAAVAEMGSVDAAVINHGVIEVAPPHEVSEQDWLHVINTNLNGCFYCAQAVGKQMIAQGRGGSIVMTSSNGSLVAFEGLSAYGASKGGVDMLCKQLAAEWGQYDIRVNTINPGYTTNPMGGKYELRTPPEFEAEVRKLTPLGRRGDPEDFVGPVIFLCSRASAFVSGHMLVVDGGYCAI